MSSSINDPPENIGLRWLGSGEAAPWELDRVWHAQAPIDAVYVYRSAWSHAARVAFSADGKTVFVLSFPQNISVAEAKKIADVYKELLNLKWLHS